MKAHSLAKQQTKREKLMDVNKHKHTERCVRSLIFSIFSFCCLEILHMVNMPAYEITLTSLILKFLLQSKDSLFLSTIIQCTRIHVCVCTYVCVGVCASVHVIAHACRWTLNSPNPRDVN